MKLLVAASVLDVALPFGCTPAWWQLLKALHEAGSEIIATPYYGQSVESLWWRAEPNPCYRIGATYNQLRNLQRSVMRWVPTSKRPAAMRGPSSAQQLLLKNVVAPRWRKHLADILRRERDIDALLILTIPLNHLFDIPAQLKREFGIPVVYFDGDLPASLPSFGGFASGFSIYEGADLAQYDCVLSNSQGALDELRHRGAVRAETLWWGADPGVFRPTPEPAEMDVLFYGLGTEFREDWLRDMIAIPSRALPELRFVAAGGKLDMDLGRAERVGMISPAQLGRYVNRARINLNIARRAHASVYASATTRVFELAAMEQCIVSNPLEGLQEWFTPGEELVVVHSAEEAIEAYRRLIANESQRRELARAARQRVLRCHTYAQRAERLLEIVRSLKSQ